MTRPQNFAALATTVGAVAVGAALFEAALIPGLAIGLTAVLAPGLLSRRLPALRRGVESVVRRAAPARPPTAATPAGRVPMLSTAALPRLQVGQALAKTVTFRIAVATLDFAWNYVVLGELETAAGLSALNLAVGPFFYFLHEAAWNYYSAPDRARQSLGSIAIVPPARPGESAPMVLVRGYTINRALAKTILYESLGVAAEFTVNLVVVGDVATAAIITAPLVVLGPFLYFGHEKIWDTVTARAQRSLVPTEVDAA